MHGKCGRKISKEKNVKTSTVRRLNCMNFFRAAEGLKSMQCFT